MQVTEENSQEANVKGQLVEKSLKNVLGENIEGQQEEEECDIRKSKRKSPLNLRAPLPPEEESQWTTVEKSGEAQFANDCIGTLPPKKAKRIIVKKKTTKKMSAPDLAAVTDDGDPSEKWFSQTERLKAIERVKMGESSDEVAKSLGIPGHKLRQWIYQLAITDWNNGSKGGRIDHDLLDRALYTWFVQKIQHGAVVPRSCLVDQARTFALRLYGTAEVVSDIWLARWQARHKIEVPQDRKSSSLLNGSMELCGRLNGMVDVIDLEEDAMSCPPSKKAKTNKYDDGIASKMNLSDYDDAIVYTADFDVLAAIEQTLKTKHLLKFTKHLESFLDLIETSGKVVEKMYDSVEKKIALWMKMLTSGDVNVDGMLSELVRQNGFNNGQFSSLVKSSKPTSQTNEVIHVGQCSLERPNLPPIGLVHRKKLTVGMKVYAMKVNCLGVWYKAHITNIKAPTTANSEVHFKIKFESRRMFPNRRLLAKHLAYCESPSVILPVGSRVIAYYRDEYGEIGNALYAGIIAEPPKKINKHRYLIFFDDGYAQYVSHKEVYLVCEASKNVWEDIHPESREFVKAYLLQYPERPMVKLQTGQLVKTEWMGQWWSAKVLEVDASLVKMFFEADKRTEWIYRGSTRLAPLFHELANAEANRLAGKTRRHNLVAKRKHQPYVEYTMGLDEPIDSNRANKPQLARKHILSDLRNVARKSTTQDDRQPGYANDLVVRSSLDSNSGTTELHRLSVFRRATYGVHDCSPQCQTLEHDVERHRDQNPLRIPMLCGWQREIVKHRCLGKRVVFYRAPCGRRLRSLPELSEYLWVTKSQLPVDLFCFDSYVHSFSEFKPSKILAYIKDITYGKEMMQVCCVNSLDTGYPPYMEYSASRFPAKGVELNLDPEFLCGCDCEDDCRDVSRCQCWQLTVAATEAMPSGRNPTVGYKYRRLMEPLITGVYECNSQCKCSKNCLNRVAQNGIQIRLQIFKTEKKGWGIRCLDDLPQGMFICNYAGQLLNEQGANEDGNQYGDEYQAELDHIEVVERNKEGYESDVPEDDEPRPTKEESKKEEESANDSESDSVNSPTEVPAQCDSDSDFDADLPLPEVASKYSTRSRVKPKTAEEKLAKRDSVKGQGGNSASQFRIQNRPLSPSTVRHLEGVRLTKRPPANEKKDSSSGSEEEKKKKEEETLPLRNLPNPSRSATLPKDKFVSLRTYFSEEYCYIMDAKNCGNIGRYLNHSCSPNVFVQNVFVDSHDLRFPWVAFFAATFIRAGTELTWDYNYEVGSVPNKRMFCYCGSSECRGRLL